MRNYEPAIVALAAILVALFAMAADAQSTSSQQLIVTPIKGEKAEKFHCRRDCTADFDAETNKSQKTTGRKYSTDPDFLAQYQKYVIACVAPQTDPNCSVGVATTDDVERLKTDFGNAVIAKLTAMSSSGGTLVPSGEMTVTPRRASSHITRTTPIEFVCSNMDANGQATRVPCQLLLNMQNEQVVMRIGAGAREVVRVPMQSGVWYCVARVGTDLEQCNNGVILNIEELVKSNPAGHPVVVVHESRFGNPAR